MVEAVSIASLLFLALLGVVGAKTGGANMLKAAIRVTFWGALAMAVTAGIGAVFGTKFRRVGSKTLFATPTYNVTFGAKQWDPSTGKRSRTTWNRCVMT